MSARHASDLELLQFDDTFEGDVRLDESMARHTTYRIGGPARAFAEVYSVAALRTILDICNSEGLQWCAVGKGSNLLVSDEGVEGVVIEVRDNLSTIRVDGTRIVAGAGATNAAVAEAACAAGLSGYEFACGIPGTVGGAAIMNAGAYDGEFSQVCACVTCVTPEGRIVEVPREEAEWSYRHSMFDAARYVVVAATLELTPADSADIRARMDELTTKREAKQPIDMPSAGSTFKRPEGHFAAALIDQAGLRGLSIGGAQVSTKHTGFIVNAGDATSADVQALIAEVQRRVLESSGVALEPEVRMWGREA